MMAPSSGINWLVLSRELDDYREKVIHSAVNFMNAIGRLIAF